MTLRSMMIAGAAALTLSPLAAQAEMSDAERADFREEVRAYLMDHPEVILEAVQSLESRQADQKAQADVDLVKANTAEIFNDDHSWVGGNPDGDITLVEFMDYRCGYCRKAFQEVEDLVAGDGNIRFVLKEFPILGEDSVMASRLAISTQLEAGDDAYKSLHDALMSYNGGFDETAMTRILSGLDLDPEPILDRMDSDEVTSIIAENHALAQQLQINGTPTFILPETMLRGYVPLAGMQQLVAEARDK
ncbi:DsbA family protein [Pseudooceanicola sediminis]|uniref:DsbA family protein n=1 Tax=Pseudooceanicola sediminis TaxID=2211117 RepID=A0A399J5J4_9RHOB|nr:DsbA family protein [Pseudooceanicola sediminis]KAA2316785.1 DsbA family protein [Puniceibacterium sp. HSS470]RII40758.1 DsbA family protein [Pseudooceanicola sediminis]|tara:strand:+ start:240077 stop:240820 length:744 start_codon:yes stop_codon:yes gene_type:complete